MSGNQLKYVAGGTLKLATGSREVPFEDRLHAIYEGLSQIIREVRPEVLAVERVFVAKNAVSALKLGQARGAVILTGKIHGLRLAEYSATQVKLAVVGHGQADKAQVAKMLQLLTGQKEFATPDASDGLALAICHALHSRSISRPAVISSGA
jgi:crossover junction endodeoxyribonuclease RuvC